MRFQKKADATWMTEALRLARLGEGLTRPNPPVGAVVVKNNKVIGRGYHRKAGGPHAEVYALRQAGSRAAGATLYVTLEPCSSWGRTPPCTDAILAAGIKRVVCAVSDPNSKHSGKGFTLLRKKGITVERGVGAEEGSEILRPFASTMLRTRPYITVKLATSLDGRIADSTGCSQWISGPEARVQVQGLRRRADAIMVGAGTVMADNPSLMPRPSKGRKPYRVIVDARGKVSSLARVFTDEFAARTILATTKRCSERQRAAYTKCGAEVMVLPASGVGVSLVALMKGLHAKGLMHVVCEGGGVLVGSLLKAGVVDELVLFVAPVMLGAKGLASVGAVNWALAEAPRMNVVESGVVGDDVMIRLRSGVQSCLPV
ncbi:MAG: bifunctional diaminohydroxyphosphoribosylaminopyrimidine deaminase/5-amino-6-(5-phosphoribosylamino)uracil reductase RibD [bacterium]